jgi:hypothetical protein
MDMGITTVSSGTAHCGLAAQGYILNRATIYCDVLVTHHTRTARNTNKK